MPRDVITVATVATPSVTAEAVVTGVAANDLELTIPNDDDKVILEVTNTDANPHDVTVVTTFTYQGYDLDDLTVTVPAGDTVMIPLTPASLFRDGTGLVSIDIATDTYLDFRAYKV